MEEAGDEEDGVVFEEKGLCLRQREVKQVYVSFVFE